MSDIITLNVVFHEQDKRDWNRVDFKDTAEYSLGKDPLALPADIIIKCVAYKYSLPEVGFNLDRYRVIKDGRNISITRIDMNRD